MSWSFRAGTFRAWTFGAQSLAGALEEAAQQAATYGVLLEYRQPYRHPRLPSAHRQAKRYKPAQRKSQYAKLERELNLLEAQEGKLLASMIDRSVSMMREREAKLERIRRRRRILIAAVLN